MHQFKSLFIGCTLLLSSAGLVFAGNGDTLKAVQAKGYIQAGVNGDLFGFDGFAKENYNHTAISLTDCEVCRLPLADLSTLRKSNPEIDQSMVSRLIKNLRQSEDMLLELGAKRASEKLASFILRLSLSDQNLSFSTDSLRGTPGTEWANLHLSRSEIGSLLGLTIETVSRFFSDWKRKGFIKEEKGSIQILDAEGLKTEACSEGACN